MTGDGDPDPVDAYLRRLPSEPPDSALRAAILDRHLQRRWRRMHLPPLAAAGLIALATLSLPLADGPDAPAAPLALVTSDSGWVELRSIDRRLQQAYIEGAADAELAQLWSRRDRVQRELEGASVGRSVSL